MTPAYGRLHTMSAQDARTSSPDVSFFLGGSADVTTLGRKARASDAATSPPLSRASHSSP
jgi:hypothetical protein